MFTPIIDCGQPFSGGTRSSSSRVRLLETLHLPEIQRLHIRDLKIWEELTHFFSKSSQQQISKHQVSLGDQRNTTVTFPRLTVYKREDNNLSHTIYWKNMHSKRYLNAKSFHQPCLTSNALQNPGHTIRKVADTVNQIQKKNILKSALFQTGYSHNNMKRALRPRKADTEIRRREAHSLSTVRERNHRQNMRSTKEMQAHCSREHQHFILLENEQQPGKPGRLRNPNLHRSYQQKHKFKGRVTSNRSTNIRT